MIELSCEELERAIEIGRENALRFLAKAEFYGIGITFCVFVGMASSSRPVRISLFVLAGVGLYHFSKNLLAAQLVRRAVRVLEDRLR